MIIEKVKEANIFTQIRIEICLMSLNCMFKCWNDIWIAWIGEWLICVWRIWATACGNRFVIWYFRLGEWLSPERKHQETHPCSYAKPRLCELRSLERETLSSKQTNLAWARVRPGFYFLPLLGSRSGETDSPKRDGLSPGLDCLAWARATAVGCFSCCFYQWDYMF